MSSYEDKMMGRVNWDMQATQNKNKYMKQNIVKYFYEIKSKIMRVSKFMINDMMQNKENLESSFRSFKQKLVHNVFPFASCLLNF